MRTPESKEATKRYVEAMRTVIRRNQDNGGSIINDSAFAESLGHSIQNINKLTTGLQDPTNDLLIRSAKMYGINPNYVLLGIGGMFLTEDIPPITITNPAPKRYRIKRRPNKQKFVSPFKPHRKPKKKMLKLVRR